MPATVTHMVESIDSFGNKNTLAIDGSETIVTAGGNVTVTGTGTTGDPYVISGAASADGSETKVVAGTGGITVTGTGTVATPYVVSIPIPPEFTKTVYVNDTNPNSATIFDLNNPPATNDNTLKADVSNIYIGTDGSQWTYNSSTGTYTTYAGSPAAPITFTATNPAASTVPNNTWVNATGYTNIVTNNTLGGWNASTGVFTAPRAGYYWVNGGIEMFSSTAWQTQTLIVGQIIKNGSVGVVAQRMQTQAAVNNVMATGNFGGSVYLAAGNTLRLRAIQTSGSNKTIASGQSSTFSVHEIR